MYNKFCPEREYNWGEAAGETAEKERVRLCAREEIILNSFFPEIENAELFLIAAPQRPGTSGLVAARAR